MQKRTPVEHPHYVKIVVVWYIAVIISGGLCALAILAAYGPSTPTYVLAIEIGASVITVTGIVAPAVVGLMLKRLGDPAAGMTASALVMCGHVMILSGPLFFTCPFVARYFSIYRHNSGGF